MPWSQLRQLSFGLPSSPQIVPPWLQRFAKITYTAEPGTERVHQVEQASIGQTGQADSEMLVEENKERDTFAMKRSLYLQSGQRDIKRHVQCPHHWRTGRATETDVRSTKGETRTCQSTEVKERDRMLLLSAIQRLFSSTTLLVSIAHNNYLIHNLVPWLVYDFKTPPLSSGGSVSFTSFVLVVSSVTSSGLVATKVPFPHVYLSSYSHLNSCRVHFPALCSRID